MNSNKTLSIKRLKRSFKFAFSGIYKLFSTEKNAKIHLVATLIVIILGILLKVSSIEWIILILCISIVLAAEAFNTSIEKLADKVSLEVSPIIKDLKDISAGGVLILALGALICGLIIFLPKLLELLI